MASKIQALDQFLLSKKHGMNVLLTGARGFLGSYLLEGLREHRVITLGRHQDDHIRADISVSIPEIPPSKLVIHAAGKAHLVPKSKEQAHLFHQINFEGTRRLADSLLRNECIPDTFVFISTVAVYGIETGVQIDENTSLSGTTPYALSKIQAEQYLIEWGALHGVNIVMLRLPLIVGKDAPGNLGAMVRNIRRGTYARIGDGEAQRSMVLASDIASLMPHLMGKQGVYHLTDGIHPSFAMLEDHIAGSFGKRIHAIPPSFASMLARIGDLIPGSPFNTYRYSKLRHSLTFSHAKAVAELGWNPTPILQGFRP
jgi:nucleoside-diphosphate-sugar epimerase